MAQQLNTLRENITKAIKGAQRSGIVGMSIANLKQVTPTHGLTITPTEYHVHFAQIAKETAHKLRFSLIN